MNDDKDKNSTAAARLGLFGDNSRQNGECHALALRYMPLIRKTARRYEGRGAEFDDLVQEGFLAVSGILEQYLRLKVGVPFSAWVVPALNHRMSNVARRLRRRWESLDALLEGNGAGGATGRSGADTRSGTGAGSESGGFDLPSEDDTEEQALASVMLEGLTQRATPAQRQILDLLAQGYSPADCARALNLTRQRVSQQIRQLRKKLGERATSSTL